MDTPAVAPPTPSAKAKRQDAERRVSVRHVSAQEAVSRPLDAQDTLSWGAQVRDVSLGGIALIVCYPFKPGTYLAIEIQGVPTAARPLLIGACGGLVADVVLKTLLAPAWQRLLLRVVGW